MVLALYGKVEGKGMQVWMEWDLRLRCVHVYRGMLRPVGPSDGSVFGNHRRTIRGTVVITWVVHFMRHIHFMSHKHHVVIGHVGCGWPNRRMVEEGVHEM
jgi:hypothetical protein